MKEAAAGILGIADTCIGQIALSAKERGELNGQEEEIEHA